MEILASTRKTETSGSTAVVGKRKKDSTPRLAVPAETKTKKKEKRENISQASMQAWCGGVAFRLKFTKRGRIREREVEEHSRYLGTVAVRLIGGPLPIKT